MNLNLLGIVVRGGVQTKAFGTKNAVAHFLTALDAEMLDVPTRTLEIPRESVKKMRNKALVDFTSFDLTK